MSIARVQRSQSENMKKNKNKLEIPRTTEATSIFFGCRGSYSKSRFLGFLIISMKFSIDRVTLCLIFGIWDFGRIRE
jgi:hypothetical protein